MHEAVTISIPTIETPRTVMRAHAPSDFEAYAAMWADPVVTRFIGGKARTREESWARFIRHAGMWRMMGFGFWAVVDKADGRFIGEAGFHDLKRDMAPSIEGLPEAGWALLPDWHGQGLATEIVQTALDWGDANLGGRRPVCIIDPENAASIRVAARCGFRRIAETTYGGQAIGLYER